MIQIGQSGMFNEYHVTSLAPIHRTNQRQEQNFLESVNRSLSRELLFHFSLSFFFFFSICGGAVLLSIGMGVEERETV